MHVAGQPGFRREKNLVQPAAKQDVYSPHTKKKRLTLPVTIITQLKCYLMDLQVG
jgi:hypothetical protein